MRRPGLIIAVFLLAGCEKPKDWRPFYSPEVFAHAADRWKERFPELQVVFGPACGWRNGVKTEDCFKMTKPQRWRGLWRNDFEGSRFCPDPPGYWGSRATECSFETPGMKIWLTDESGKEPDMKLYRVEFIGRRTLYPGLFGHMAVTDGHEIIVDRFLSVRQVGPPPSEAQVKAMVEAEWKRCEAAGSCISSFPGRRRRNGFTTKRCS